MQVLLLLATHSGISAVAMGLLLPQRPPLTLFSPNFLNSIKTRKLNPLFSSFASYDPLNAKRSNLSSCKASFSAVSPSATSFNTDADKAKLAQVARRLESTLRYFKRLGNLAFGGQLVCTLISAVILSFLLLLPHLSDLKL